VDLDLDEATILAERLADRRVDALAFWRRWSGVTLVVSLMLHALSLLLPQVSRAAPGRGGTWGRGAWYRAAGLP